jgi:mono/diheme cytochrome c family protein
MNVFLLLAACSGNDTRAGSAPAGQSLFALQACATCHGDHGQGSMLAPALVGAHASWTREKLAEYLADPQGYAAKDPRLSKQGKGYMQPMPSYKLLKPEERESLADYVLGLR